MNSIHPSNQQEKKENEVPTSFSFSYDKDRKIDPQVLLRKVRNALQEILNSRHSHYEKRTIHPKSERWNFACPYCGDSGTNPYKKRGNIYTDKFYFKCYNCGKYTDVAHFLKDFNKGDILNGEEQFFVHEAEESTKQVNRQLDPSYLYDMEKLKKFAIDRNTIEEKLNLKRVDKSSIQTYLHLRLQPRMDIFSWNQEKKQLYIFHLIPDTNMVLGFQVRNFKSYPKYMTYRLSRIYEMLGKVILKDQEEELDEIDEISTIFGILTIDMTHPITIFEGPLDSFLYKNSVATCSTNIDFPIDISSLRYFYDYDKAGRDAAIQKMGEGKPVFLWKKFFKEAHINEPTNKKMDLTDLVVLAKGKRISLPRLSNFFSNDKYDLYWI